MERNKPPGAKSERRDRGEGAVYYDEGKKRWRASFFPVDGGPRKYVSARSEKEVEQKLLQAQAADARWELVERSTQTLGNYMDSWIEDKKLELKPGVYQTWRNRIELHIKADLGQWQLQRLRPDQLRAWIRKLIGKGLAASTIHGIYEIVRLALADAVRRRLLSKSPCEDITLPRIDEEEMQVLDPDQARTLFSWLKEKGHRHEALIGIAILTGMRQGEELALKWPDVKLDGPKPTVTIQRTVDYINGEGYVVTEPKTKGSRRTILLTPEAVRLFRLQRAQQIEQRLRASSWEDKDLIFANPRGGYYQPSGIYQIFKRILAWARLPEVRWHDLRHTAATLMLISGMSIITLQKVLGHKDIETTMRYLHVLPDMMEQDMQRFHESLFQSRA